MKIHMTNDRRMPIVGAPTPYNGYADTEPPDRPEDIPETVYGQAIEALPTDEIRAAASDLTTGLPTDVVQTFIVEGGQLVQTTVAQATDPAPGSPSWLPWALGAGAAWLLWKSPWLVAAALALPVLGKSQALSGCQSCRR